MRKFFFISGVFLLIASLVIFTKQNFFVGSAELVVESEPEALVFIDGVQVGTTPLTLTRKPSEVAIKLIPNPSNPGLAPYETRVLLLAGIQTVIKRTLGETRDSSSGYVLSFERRGGKHAALSVVSSPEGAQLSIDGKVIGITPDSIDPIEQGEHAVKISAAGYAPLEFSMRAIDGYRLTAPVSLAKLPSDSTKEDGEQSLGKRIYIEILTTPTGFLRVREEPSVQASESARVTPGGRYPFVEERVVGDVVWYEIEYLPAQAGFPAGSGGEAGKTGWVSGQYAKKIEETLQH